MNRSIRYQVIVVLFAIGGFSVLAGLSIGLWCLVDASKIGVLFLRGSVLVAAVLGGCAITGMLLTRWMTKPIKAAQKAILDISNGHIPEDSTYDGALEISNIRKSLHKLGEKIEQEKKDTHIQAVDYAREIRTEALIRLSRGIAREVQNPLAGLIGFAEMALKQPGVDGQVKSYLTLIDQEARAGRQSLERVFRYIGNDDFATEPIDLNHLMIEASQSIDSSEHGVNIRLRMNLTDSLPRIMGDPGQLSQVLSIIIQNAKDAIGQDGEIEMNSTTDQSGQVVIMIKDSGCGIAEELQEKVFTPFFTTKGNIRGAGLNLATADSIIRNHKGKLEFFSSVNEGTTFFIKLPISKSKVR